MNRTSVEENLRLLDEATAALNAHDWDRFAGLHVESVIQRDPANPEGLKGRAAIREQTQIFDTAFPDRLIRKERSFGQGDWVCMEGIITGTHRGPFMAPGGRTIPATNKAIRVRASVVAKVDRGEFTEVNVYFDQLALLVQLGLAP